MRAWLISRVHLGGVRAAHGAQPRDLAVGGGATRRRFGDDGAYAALRSLLLMVLADEEETEAAGMACSFGLGTVQPSSYSIFFLK